MRNKTEKERRFTKMSDPAVIIFQLPANLKHAVEERARENDRSVSAEVRRLIRRSLEAEPAAPSER
jgi:plasmid stability protein